MEFWDKKPYFNIGLKKWTGRANLSKPLEQVNEPLASYVVGYKEQLEEVQLKAQDHDVVHIAVTVLRH